MARTHAPSQAAATVQSAVSRMPLVQARIARRIENATGSNMGHTGILQAVAGGAVQVRDVADAMRIHVSSASRQVDQLVQQGLVLRREDPDDRRAVILSLTDAGTDVVDAVEVEVGRILTAIMDEFDDDADADRFAALFQRFVDAAFTTMSTDADI